MQSLQGDQLLHLPSEMDDDPLWSENDASFTWDKCHEYLARPRSYATFYLLATWVRVTNVGVTFLSEADGQVALRWNESAQQSPLLLLHQGRHEDDLLAPQASA